jgi:diguanylate cyclase
MHSYNNTLLSLKEARSAFESLSSVIVEHAKWLAYLSKHIICDIPLSADDMAEDAFEHCEFGLWLKSDEASFLKDLESLQKIDFLHKKVHLYINEMLLSRQKNIQITQNQFDAYLDSEKKFTILLVELRDEIYRLIFSYDYLTGTLTRQAIFHILYTEQARINRHAESSCIVMIDLDYFKSINDKHGHQAGDDVLVVVAEHFTKHLRPYDAIGRYGGEEFLLCLPDVTLDKAKKTMKRISSDLSRLEICTSQQTCLSVTVSMGIASMSPGENMETVIKHADNALYQAKNRGRNRVECWE